MFAQVMELQASDLHVYCSHGASTFSLVSAGISSSRGELRTSGPMSVPVLVHQPAPGRTLAIWPAPDLSCKDSTRDHCVDVDHQPTDLAVGRESGGCDV